MCRLPIDRGAHSAAGAGPPPRTAAFTLIELMVVISLLALLAAILLPSMSQVYQVAYSTMCRKNLHGLAQAMHGNSVASPLTVPRPSAWVGAAVQFGSKELLFCMEDHEERRAAKDELEDVYVLQYNHMHQWEVTSVRSVVDWMDGGAAVVDAGSQIYVMSDRPSAGGIHAFNRLGPDVEDPRPNLSARWLPEPSSLEDNQYVILVYDDAGIKVTVGETIVIESVDGEKDGLPRPGGGFYCNSCHWLVRGQISGWDNSQNHPEKAMPGVRVLQHLTGLDHVNVVDSPVALGTGRASYGMNGLIQPKRFAPRQLMLMDANWTHLDVTQVDWMDHIKPRHMGKVNVVSVAGSVRSMTLAELRDQYLLFQEAGPISGSLWGSQGCTSPED